MSKITVDRSKFNQAASQIESHVSEIKKQMSKVMSMSEDLANAWDGNDRVHFKKEFDELDDKESTYRKYISTLESYASFIRGAEETYRKAQEDAYNIANKLPTFF